MIKKALAQGWRRRCPRCGEGELFRRRLETFDHCPDCGLQYQPNHGDTLMFMVLTNRIPILFGVIAVYFLGFRSSNLPVTIAFLIAMTVPLLATLRERQGVALAMVLPVATVFRRSVGSVAHTHPLSGGGVRLLQSARLALDVPAGFFTHLRARPSVL